MLPLHILSLILIIYEILDMFRTVQDWHDYLNQHRWQVDIKQLREQCIDKIMSIRVKPLLVYASKFIWQGIVGFPNNITIEDVAGFTDMVNSVPVDKKEVDVLIHSPGWDPAATERIVGILRNRFDKVNFIIPHSAYSAATMLSLSGNEIILHPSATLWPIDPQLNWTPARSIKRWFDNIKQKITEEWPESLPAYIPLIEKYSIDLLEQCEDAEKLSEELVAEWLKKYMFDSEAIEDSKIEEIVKYFSSYDTHKLHSRPLIYEKVKELGIKIKLADWELKDAIWEAYILLDWFFSNTPFVKLYETNYWISWWTQAQAVLVQWQSQPSAR